MSISKIDLTEAMKLEFDVKVEGARGDNPTVNFVIESDGMSLKFAGAKHNGAYVFDIPPLKGIVPPGKKECFLECIIDDHYFKPINDTIEIIQPIVVESAVKVSDNVSALKVSATQEGSKYVVTNQNKFKELSESFGYKIKTHEDKLIAMDRSEVKGAYDLLKGSGVVKGKQ
jgi:hypothetical protein